MIKRMAPTDRKASILDAAVTVARRHGYSNFRMHHVSTEAGCSNALVVIYWKTMEQIRRDVMRVAIRERHLDIIATGIALKDPRCRKLPAELHQAAIDSLTK